MARVATRQDCRTGSSERADRVHDGQGGWLRVWAPVAVNETCELEASSGSESEIANSERGVAKYVLKVRTDVDVQRDDRWRISTGEVLRIKTVRRLDERPEVALCDAEEIQVGT